MHQIFDNSNVTDTPISLAELRQLFASLLFCSDTLEEFIREEYFSLERLINDKEMPKEERRKGIAESRSTLNEAKKNVIDAKQEMINLNNYLLDYYKKAFRGERKLDWQVALQPGMIRMRGTDGVEFESADYHLVTATELITPELHLLQRLTGIKSIQLEKAGNFFRLVCKHPKVKNYYWTELPGFYILEQMSWSSKLYSTKKSSADDFRPFNIFQVNSSDSPC